MDIKKTKYKKFSAFLKEMNKVEGGPLVKTVLNKAKGIELISEVMSKGERSLMLLVSS